MRGPASTSPVPPASDDIPFQELTLDGASAFLYAALLPEEVLALVKRLGLGQKGFRPEALGEVERCDLLAEELRAHAPSRAPLLATLRKGLKEPAFSGSSLDPSAADELLEVAGSDHGLAIALWRLLCDAQPEVRAVGAAALERLAAEWYGPGPDVGAEQGESEGPADGEGPRADGSAPAPRPRPGPPRDASADERVAEADRKVRSAEERAARAEAKVADREARAEEQRLRGETQREKLQQQLKEARAEAARGAEESARSREAAELARGAQGRAEAALAAARSSDGAAELTRLKGALRDAEVARHAAEAQTARAAERLEALVAELAEARSGAAAAGGAAGAGSGAGEVRGAHQGLDLAGDEVEEAPATWLLPIFSAEFYDSLAGWDRRIQRAALKQAFLLSQDWRHPSLRALALEGLPGYYRVRVATDVRLIYRRGERQDAVELCSLIDREDLDRYVRQAKTR